MADDNANGDGPTGPGSTARVPPSAPCSPHLLIVAADGRWTSRSLPADCTLTIGRGGQVDVQLEERSVSRLHARLEVAGATELWLVDLGSENGTLVGGKLVRNITVPVRPGEPILIGRTLLAVHDLPPAQTPGGGPLPVESVRAMDRVDAQVAKVAPTLRDVLLLGETGVGKGVIAERIHRLSTRARGPLTQINCAGLSAELLESELFGHERGAFTGAVQAKPGLLAKSAGGTVFLDEVGEMPMEVQAKLLLVIENRVTRRVGGTQSTPIDVRFIFATHRDLEAEIRRGRFRGDFYYRISGVSIHIPPLRERRDELDGLIALFAKGAAASLQRERPPELGEDARAALHRHDWPGNIRDLRNVVELAVLHAEDNEVTTRSLVAAGLPVGVLPPPGGPSEEAERERVIAALNACGGNQSRAARILNISRNTLIRRIRRYNLQRPRGKGRPS